VGGGTEAKAAGLRIIAPPPLGHAQATKQGLERSSPIMMVYCAKHRRQEGIRWAR